jgi:hypothetical protein
MRTRRVSRWTDVKTIERRLAASLLATEKNFRRIVGWNDLWQLKAPRKRRNRKSCGQPGGRVT